MKAAASKTRTSNVKSHHSRPFFNKNGEGSFFSQSKETEQPFFSPETVQPKLTIGQPNDPYEQESDAMADRVVGQIESSKSHPVIQAKYKGHKQDNKLQKKEEEDSEMEIMKKPFFESNGDPPEDHIQTKAFIPDIQISPEWENNLQSSKGAGSPIPENTRKEMETGFGANFEKVRIHTDHQAVQMNQELGAQAFTHGSDVYFNKGKYDTEGKDGKKLLAHELTHVVQQRNTQANKIFRYGYSGLKDRSSKWKPNKIVRIQRRLRELGNYPAKRKANGKLDSVTIKGLDDAFGYRGWMFMSANKVHKILQKKVADNKPTPKRNAIKAKAINNLNMLEREYEIRFIKWRIAARNVGSAYDKAADLHAKALGDRDKVIAQRQAIMFAVLTAATAGSLSWLSTVGQAAQAAKAAKAGKELSKSKELFINVLEDTVQAGTGEAIDVAQLHIMDPSTPVSQNPLVYQNDMLNYLDQLLIKVKEYVQQVVKKLEDQTMVVWDTFDPEKQKKIYFEKLGGSKLAQVPNLPNVASMQKELERAMWAKWLPSLKRIEKQWRGGMHTGGYRDTTVYDDPTSPVEDRLDKLGISKESGVGKLRGSWTWEDEVKKLISWANSYKQPTFIGKSGK